MTVSMERESQERFRCSVTGDSPIEGSNVEFAFTLIQDEIPRPETWYSGDWVIDSEVNLGTSYSAVARTPLLGTGALDLEVGTWQVWLRLPGGVDTPVVKVDRIRVK